MAAHPEISLDLVILSAAMAATAVGSVMTMMHVSLLCCRKTYLKIHLTKVKISIALPMRLAARLSHHHVNHEDEYRYYNDLDGQFATIWSMGTHGALNEQDFGSNLAPQDVPAGRPTG
jgi:hypothetical protein